MEDVLKKIQDPQMIKELNTIIKFHGFLSSGALIGYQMLNIARNELNITEGERIYVTSETINCVPDPFQILMGATIGSKRLTVQDYDKMAVTINKGAGKDEKFVKGIRIFLDSKKTKNYPKLHAWYMNYERVRHEEVVPILMDVCEDIYSWKFVEVEVPEKKKKNVFNCQICGESFVSWDNNQVCIPCSKLTKTDKI